MASPNSPTRPRFRWKRFFAALLIVFLSTEFAGASLTLLVLAIPEWVRLLQAGGSIDFNLAGAAGLAIVGLVLTSIPAAVYSLIMVTSFLRFSWTRKLPFAIAYALGLTLPAFVLGWIFIMSDVLPGMEEKKLRMPLAIVSLASAAAGAWVLHRYFKIVERHDFAA